MSSIADALDGVPSMFRFSIVDSRMPMWSMEVVIFQLIRIAQTMGTSSDLSFGLRLVDLFEESIAARRRVALCNQVVQPLMSLPTGEIVPLSHRCDIDASSVEEFLFLFFGLFFSVGKKWSPSDCDGLKSVYLVFLQRTNITMARHG